MECDMHSLALFMTKYNGKGLFLMDDSAMNGSISSIGSICTKTYQHWMDSEEDRGFFVILDEVVGVGWQHGPCSS